jgi:hypothetical protein
VSIEHSIRWMQGQIAVIAPEHPNDVVRGYVDIWRQVLEATGFHAGCAVAGVVTSGHDPNMLDRGAAAFAATSDASQTCSSRSGYRLAPLRNSRRCWCARPKALSWNRPLSQNTPNWVPHPKGP